MLIDQLCDLYLAWAGRYYRKPKSRRLTRSTNNIRDACRELRETRYRPRGAGWQVRLGGVPAAEMTARMLYACQQQMAESGRLSRRTCNDRIDWIKRMFRWAAGPEQELIDETVPARLALVKPLAYGRTPAREPEPVQSVEERDVQQTALYASAKLRAMIFIQWHTGMRPAEVCCLAKSAIDTATDPWIYRPHEHKSDHHRKERAIPIGPRGQQGLCEWWDQPRGDWLFEGHRHGVTPTGAPMHRNSYSQAILRINRQHGLAEWSPNQIRHAFATRIERETGDERAAQLLLDHSDTRTTRGYIDADTQRKLELMRQYG